ncbi:MAG: hypothetical protein M8354_03595 [Halalkalicoccus sp.]|nr:hypothetical protein [Halalkalicoccus sp.]
MSKIPLPTTRNDWHLVARTTRLVLWRPTYALFAAVSSAVVLTGLVLSLNLPFAHGVLLGSDLPVTSRLELLALQYPFVGPLFSPAQGAILIGIGILVGIDLALLVYHLSEHRISVRGGSGSVAGVVLGALGAGCAACGPVVLAGVLSLIGATGLFTLLPLAGLEIAIAAAGLLVLSIYWLADGMRGGRIDGCPIDPSADPLDGS